MQTFNLIPNISLDEVWATFDGAVWGVDANGVAYQYNAATQTFTSISGNLTEVVLGNAANVWGTSATNGGAVYLWF